MDYYYDNRSWDEDEWGDEEHCPYCSAGEVQPCEEWCETQRLASEPDPADD